MLRIMKVPYLIWPVPELSNVSCNMVSGSSVVTRYWHVTFGG